MDRGAKLELYQNLNGIPEKVVSWSSNLHITFNGSIGDIDADGINDLVLAGYKNPHVAYRGTSEGVFEDTPFWQSANSQDCLESDAPSFILDNNGGEIGKEPIWISNVSDSSESVSWGDVNNDGYPELFTANHVYYRGGEGMVSGGGIDYIYYNDSGRLSWCCHPEKQNCR